MRAAPFTSADFLDSGQYKVADLRERLQHACFSRRHDHPLEKHAQPQVSEACGTVHLYRLEDGRLLARRVDCRTKACPKCGPRLRAEYAAGYAAVLADEVVYRLVVAGRDWRRLQVRLARRGAEYLRIPGPDGTLVVWTTADLGATVQRRAIGQALAADFGAMPSDRRNVSASNGWRQAYHAWHDQQQDASKPAEYLGRLRRPLEQVAMIADDLGLLAGDPGLDRLYLRAPPDADTWRRFCALVGLQQPSQAAA